MPFKSFIKRCLKNLTLLLFLLFLLITKINAQDYFFDNYSVKEGLKKQKVYTIIQDSKDYFWFGTSNGVSRFDGKKFDNFSSRNGLAASGVRYISEDDSGYIWFGHLNGGLSRYDGNVFDTVAFDSLRIFGDITAIVQIKDKIWFTTTNEGAIRADFPVRDSKHIKGKQFNGSNGLSNQVFGAYVSKDGSFICMSDAGLRRFYQRNNSFETFTLPHLTTYFSTLCMLEDKDDNIWFGTFNGGIYKYSFRERKMDFIDLPTHGVRSNTVTCLTQDSKGRIWAGTWDGGIALIEGDSVRALNSSNGLMATRIYDIVEDVEGNILIADQNNGISIYKGDAFQTITDEAIIPDLNINTVYEDKKGALWFGTTKGISCYIPGSKNKPITYTQANSNIYEDVRFIKEDKNGNLWVGSNEGGVILFNMKTSKFEPQPHINSKLYNNGQVKALEVDNDNNLWIGTVEGVAVGTIGEENFQRYTLLDSIVTTVITALYCDPNGDMWIGVENRGDKPGLIKFDSDKKRFNAIHSLRGISPTTMLLDKNGILWTGTDDGLFLIRNDSLLLIITEDDGLLSNTITSLSTDEHDNIYIGTSSGLNRYSIGSKRTYSYTERNGLSGNEILPNASFKSHDGFLWFGTSHGVTRLNPDKLLSEGLEPMTHILGMQVNYEPRKMVHGMRLKYNENTVVFDYYSICLTNPDVVRFRVKLDGAEKEWRPVTDQTSAIYSALPAGKYKFNVTASNSQGIWNTRPTTFGFVVLPPFYFQWWFILIVIVLFIVFIGILIRSQTLLRDKRVLEIKVKERTAEIAQKNIELEDKNRNITSSIVYAERIQRAMLPKEDALDDTFVLFLPKDIVSGDFYWMYENEEFKFIAAVDCTGHGVPGAFMSIIGHNSLNKVIREYGITQPAEIIDKLNIEVMGSLLQRHEKAINDGMDLALIAFNKKNFTLDFAGAFNPLVVVRKGEVFVYKGDKFPIGMTTMDSDLHFTNNSINIQPGDMIYLFSDGYADQFGYATGKKFKSKNIKKILSGISHLSMQEQKYELEKEISDWRGPLEQVDDILFIGTRIPSKP
jgi:ligand-binding sensor domain-containing protein/serine phosphatase RsbU (regulator of sigma subunit)